METRIIIENLIITNTKIRYIYVYLRLLALKRFFLVGCSLVEHDGYSLGVNDIQGYRGFSIWFV